MRKEVWLVPALALLLTACLSTPELPQLTPVPDPNVSPMLMPIVSSAPQFIPVQTPTPTPALVPTSTPTTAPTPTPKPYRWAAERVYDAELAFEPSEDGTLYAFLTFDDGPSSQTLALLDILEEHDVPATFFLLGTNAEKHPEWVSAIADAGHTIANHSYSHVYSTIYSGEKAFHADYQKSADIFDEIVGEFFNSRLIRMPGGGSRYGGKYAKMKAIIESNLEDYEMISVNWNVTNGDGEIRSPTSEQCIEHLYKTMGKLKSNSNLLILMHDGGTRNIATLESLPQIIEELKEKGYVFMALC